MKHTSVRLDTPCEFINITPLNPLISKCQIKVCYVSDEPNRNKSIITKEVAKEMANSLPGSPIVGFYNENNEDFEEHNRVIDISNGKFEIKDTTRPYGFVDLNAKCWFATYLDDGQVEREYLMTEGYLWTGQYPECKRIIEHGNNQSMELDPNTLQATWTKNKNGNPQFFIINEAVVSKLCILGEDCEPCFEGAAITDIQFSFEDGFKQQLFSMIEELNELLKGGETQVFTKYAVEIGDKLWNNLFQYLDKTYPLRREEDCGYCCSMYRIEGIFEEQGQKFAVIEHRENNKLYRLNFELSEVDGFIPSETLVEVTKTYKQVNVEPQFDVEAVAVYELEYKKKQEEKEEEEEDKKEQSASSDSEEQQEDESEDSQEDEEEEDEEDKKKNKYSLEEIPEYVELMNKYAELQSSFDALNEELSALQTFKAQVEKAEKEQMIESFYMLSEEDKKDVVENIDTYSLKEIEAELSIMCVRNRVNFNLEDGESTPEGNITYNLNGGELSEETTPAWIKAAMSVEKKMNE